MSTIISAVTDAEAKVVEAVRNLQEPVVGYVRKGVDLADGRVPAVRYPGRLPRLAYPEALPKPAEIVDSQVDFVKALLDAQRDLVKAIVGTLAPLAHGAPADTAERAAKAPKAARQSKATKAAKGPA